MSAPLTPDPEAAITFLELLRPGGPWALTAITPDGPATTTETFYKPEAVAAWISHQNQTRNIYWMPAEANGTLRKKAGKDDIAQTRLLWADVDGPLNGHAALPPTTIVASGGGSNLYWSLAEPIRDKDEIEARNRWLAKELGADHCWNADRILRLPGTINRPNRKKQSQGRVPVLARCTEHHPDRVYGLGDLGRVEGSAHQGKGAPVDDDAPLLTLDDLPAEIRDKLPALARRLIREGPGPREYRDDRSKAVFTVTCALVRADASDAQIAGILLNPDLPIHAHVAEQKGHGPRAYVTRQIERARERVEETPKGHDPAPMVPLEIADFLALALREREMLLDPVVPAQGLVMLFAPRGVGKTHLGLTMAYAVASGGSLFRWNAPKPVPVLFVDGEMPGRAMQERVAAIVASNGTEPPPGYLRFVLADLHEDGLPDLASEEGQLAIVAALGAAKLLVLDNLSSLVRSGRENEADSWQPVQDFLLRLRRKGVSVLLIHHAGKGGQQRGTSRREDVLDTVISLRRPTDYQPSEGARFELHIEKCRGTAGEAVNPFEAKLEVRDGAATWTTRGIEDAELSRVVALTEDGFTTRDIAAETGMSVGKINKLQRRAVDEGIMPEKPKRGGKGGRHFDGTAGDD